MKFFDRVKIAFNQTSFDEYMRNWLSGEENSPTGEPDTTGNASLKFTAVFACLRVLAETFASVPVFEYQKVDDSDRIRTNETGWHDILHNVFNEEMSAYNAKEMAMYQLNLSGNVVMQRLLTVGGDPVALYPYEWQRVDIGRHKDTRALQYIIDRKQDAPKARRDVFHVPGPSLDGVIGMSPIEYASRAIKLGLTYESFNYNFFRNGALSSGFFEHPGHLNDESFRRLKESIAKEYTGLKNAGTPILLEDGLKFSPLQLKLVDAELLASKKFQVEDVCRIYRVQPHLIQNLDKATNNNIEHQSLEFVMYTMLPWFKRWEEAINSQLLTKEQRADNYYFEFNMASLLRGDQKSMAEAFAIGRQWGYLSVNDIRRLLNMNKIDGGDIYLQPMNMVEAGKVQDDVKKDIENIYKLIEKRGA
jgi:HK97 family phage portal protein